LELSRSKKCCETNCWPVTDTEKLKVRGGYWERGGCSTFPIGGGPHVRQTPADRKQARENIFAPGLGTKKGRSLLPLKGNFGSRASDTVACPITYWKSWARGGPNGIYVRSGALVCSDDRGGFTRRFEKHRTGTGDAEKHPFITREIRRRLRKEKKWWGPWRGFVQVLLQ